MSGIFHWAAIPIVCLHDVVYYCHFPMMELAAIVAFGKCIPGWQLIRSQMLLCPPIDPGTLTHLIG